MSVRYQVSLGSIGGALEAERQHLAATLIGMGHFPVDLTRSGVLAQELESQRSHIDRTDYLVLLVGPETIESGDALDGVGRTFELAIGASVPVLRLVAGGVQRCEMRSVSADVNHLCDLLTDDIPGAFESLDKGIEPAVWAMIRMIDIYKRPGWISTSEVPSEQVASELARLSEANATLHARLAEEDEAIELRKEQRFQSTTEALRGNKILIPLWARAGSSWESPIEITLYDFFVHAAPELAVEQSTAAIATFIPAGVCGLDAGEYRSVWPVPPNSLNLWMADLMALGLVEPSQIKHTAKDANQYWALTSDGRELVSRIRRDALQVGGHRHVGFTQEFQIVRPDLNPPPRR